MNKYRPAHSSLAIKKAGFTLFELLAVIAVLSVMLALTFPVFGGIGQGGLKSDARKLSSALRSVYENAVSRKASYPVKFLFSEHAVSWTMADGETSMKVDTLSGVEMPSKGLVRDGEITILFEPVGPREPLIVHLEKDDSFLRVIFNPISGRVYVREGRHGGAS